MRRNFFHHQSVAIDDFVKGRIQVNRQIANGKSLVCAESFLVGKRAASSHQQIDKARSLGEESCSIGAENVVSDWSVGGQRAGIEEGRQVAGVIDVQMRQQNCIYFVQVQAQFADSQE